MRRSEKHHAASQQALIAVVASAWSLPADRCPQQRRVIGAGRTP